MKHVLTIAGSDGSGGAGIQGDLKTIAGHGCHGLSVITAITAQSTTEITSILPVSNISDQLEVLMDDIQIDSIKIGMVYDELGVEAIIKALDRLQAPVVYDPVMVSSTGKSLMVNETMEAIKSLLIPRVSLLTPNRFEAAYLSGKTLGSKAQVEAAAKEIYSIYGCKVLIKGGHMDGPKTEDYLYDGIQGAWYALDRIEAHHTHGTGCCLSSAIACRLSLGDDLHNAVQNAKAFTHEAIKHGYSIGRGEGPVDSLLHLIRRQE